MTPFQGEGKNSKISKTKMGRRQELELRDLPTRYKDMKWFLENYWGYIWLGLKKVTEPEDVRKLLTGIPNIEWLKPFKGHAKCFINEEVSQASPAEIRATRQQWKAAEKAEEQLWLQYHTVEPEAQMATRAAKSAISEFNDARGTLLFFQAVNLIAAELNVQELTSRSSQSLSEVYATQKKKDSIKKTLDSQEAWFARSQVVAFRKNRRFSRTLLNCARAFAGLPEWGWFHSRRTCEEKVKEQPPAAAPYELFELLRAIARNMKPLKLSRVEQRLREELLKPENALLKGYVAPQWLYVQESIHHCVGIKKSEVAYAILARFTYHCDRTKTPIETERARRNQLV